MKERNNDESVLGTFLTFLFKALWKLLLICLWGLARIATVIFEAIANLLKGLIS